LTDFLGTAANEKSTFYLVFTFCDYDLAGLLSELKVRLAIEDIKCMMKHILEGLYKIHSSGILHRDMKTANILISPEGVLKLADFGLSRQTISKDCIAILIYCRYRIRKAR
jgi:cyclin-dependent kinase 9